MEGGRRKRGARGSKRKVGKKGGQEGGREGGREAEKGREMEEGKTVY